MGQFVKNIAKETKTPAIVSLSDNPNFVQFEKSDDRADDVFVNLEIKVIGNLVINDNIALIIEEYNTQTVYNIKARMNDSDFDTPADDFTFYVDFDDRTQTAQNLFACLKRIDFLRNNFTMYIPLYENTDTIYIKSLGAGINYAFTIEHGESLSEFFIFTGDPMDTVSNDSISGGNMDVKIEIDIYRNVDSFLGVSNQQSDFPGDYALTLFKNYIGRPVWFDVNSIFKNGNKFSNIFLDASGWIDTGTIQNMQFIVYRSDEKNKTPFYLSDVMYIATGYNRTLEANDIKDYVYDTKEGYLVNPLTTMDILTHMKGQTQYFNFILSDPDRNNDLGANEYDLGIIYRLYTQSGNLIGETEAHTQNRKEFNVINTIKLDIDGAIGELVNVGKVEVYLSRSGSPVSKPLTFWIIPECLFKLNEFAFLNSLGGWSSFNFSGTETIDFSTSVNTTTETQTPDHTTQDKIESVFTKDVSEQFIAQTGAINESVCIWLKELSASVAVYELSTKRYIVVDELNIKPDSATDLFRLEMKYHYSDKFNAV